MLLSPVLASAGGLSDVESIANSDGAWTAFAFPAAISEKAKVKVTKVTCEKPKLEEVDFVLVPKGKCEGAAGSPRPKGATHPDKLEGTTYKLNEKDLCAGTAKKELKCVIYADTEW